MPSSPPSVPRWPAQPVVDSRRPARFGALIALFGRRRRPFQGAQPSIWPVAAPLIRRSRPFGAPITRALDRDRLVRLFSQISIPAQRRRRDRRRRPPAHSVVLDLRWRGPLRDPRRPTPAPRSVPRPGPCGVDRPRPTAVAREPVGSGGRFASGVIAHGAASARSPPGPGISSAHVQRRRPTGATLAPLPGPSRSIRTTDRSAMPSSPPSVPRWPAQPVVDSRRPARFGALIALFGRRRRRFKGAAVHMARRSPAHSPVKALRRSDHARTRPGSARAAVLADFDSGSAAPSRPSAASAGAFSRP